LGPLFDPNGAGALQCPRLARCGTAQQAPPAGWCSRGKFKNGAGSVHASLPKRKCYEAVPTLTDFPMRINARNGGIRVQSSRRAAASSGIASLSRRCRDAVIAQ
jgi:hypothetical protein